MVRCGKSIKRQGVVARPLLSIVVLDDRCCGRHIAALKRRAYFQLGGHALAALARDDVDGACNGLRPRLGRGCAVNFHTLNHLGREGLDRKARRHALTVQQNLCVALAQATHANAATPARRTTQSDARHALQNFAKVSVPLTLNLFSSNHNFAGGRFAALLGFVVTPAGDFNAAHVRSGCSRRRRLLRQSGERAESKRDEKRVSGGLEVHIKKFTEVWMPLPCKVQVFFLTQVP